MGLDELKPESHDVKCPECGQYFRDQHGVKDFIQSVWQMGVQRMDVHRAEKGENWHDMAIAKGKIVCSNCHKASYIQARFSHEEHDKVITTWLFYITPVIPGVRHEVRDVSKAF